MSTQFSKFLWSEKGESAATFTMKCVCHMVQSVQMCVTFIVSRKISERGGEVHFWMRHRVEDHLAVCEFVIGNFTVLMFSNLYCFFVSIVSFLLCVAQQALIFDHHSYLS